MVALRAAPMAAQTAVLTVVPLVWTDVLSSLYRYYLQFAGNENDYSLHACEREQLTGRGNQIIGKASDLHLKAATMVVTTAGQKAGLTADWMAEQTVV